MEVLWIGGLPAHYTRAWHIRLECEFGDRIRFLYLKGRGISGESIYEIAESPKSSIFLGANNWLEIWKQLEVVNPRLVIVAGHYPRGVMIGWLWCIANNRRVAYWGDTNILDTFRKSRLKRVVEIIWKRFLFRWVDDFLYVGVRSRDYYGYVVGYNRLEDRLFKVPLPAIINAAPRQPKNKDTSIRMLYVGRLISSKCIDSIINAMALLPVYLQGQVLLTIAGDGPERYFLEALADDLGLSGKIKFLGAIPSNEVGKVYAGNDILVLTSRYEAWGLVVNEALGAGLPIIAPYWIGAVADLVIDGYTGFVMEDNQPETIKQAIIRAMEMNRKHLALMGEHGAELVRVGGYNLDTATSKLIAYIEYSIN